MKVSVVLGFKNWGLDRLAISLANLVPQTLKADGEVIVVDYGSTDAKDIQHVVEAVGAKLVRVDNGDPWSRSRALNAGLAQAKGEYLITTDADMIFTPKSIEKIIDRLRNGPQRACILQCKDLPAWMNAEFFQSHSIDWDLLEENASFRPRYGMGGMIACSREAFLRIRGFDERMHTYGGEDLDFAQRLKRSGAKFDWINDSEVGIYHIWHPSSRQASQKTVKGAEAVAQNSQILENDDSYIRNLKNWKYRPVDAPPLASVVISTRNRVNYLKEALDSIFGQTVQDFEVIVVDDGSTDETWEYLNSISDPRLVPLRQEGRGLAAARNLATHHARADWIVIHDDDDLMLPDRIENHFKAVSAGIGATYGGWIDFENFEGGNVKVNTGRDFTPDAIRFVGSVYLHPTLMVRKDFMLNVPYDETFRSGSDYNLAQRLVRSGIKMKHMGSIAIMRRLHDKQVTHADSSYQRASWAVSQQFGRPSASLTQVKFKQKNTSLIGHPGSVTGIDGYAYLRRYGPDKLSNRNLFVSGFGILPGNLSSSLEGPTVRMLGSGKAVSTTYVHGYLANATLSDVAKLRGAGFSIEYAMPGQADDRKLPLNPLFASLLGDRPGKYLAGTDLAEEGLEGRAFELIDHDSRKEGLLVKVDELPEIFIMEMLDSEEKDLVYLELEN